MFREPPGPASLQRTFRPRQFSPASSPASSNICLPRASLPFSNSLSSSPPKSRPKSCSDSSDGTSPSVRRAPFALLNFGFLAWGLAAIAPDLVLLYSLTRRPGPSAFAYSLVIPTLHILFGLTGHSALLFLIPHSGQAAIPFLSIIPWILDIFVPYLTWKAIRFTGIRPDPTRLIAAFVVILIYRILLPALFVLLN
jgi:hypothetical protein